jgi:eukaryotic-like serine/threonine-protein kinase
MTTVGVPALPPRLAERYEAGPVIGRGLGSAVFRAHDTLLGRDAAVKTFRVESEPRAHRELRLLAMMDHPGLVPVYDVEEHDGRAFVVMALLDGGSLAERVGADGTDPDGLRLGDALRTGGTVAGALDHVHRAGVLHRAVTPANVLYDGDGRAHLSDFGVAFVADAPRITDTGLTVGAAPYLAPEQVRGEPADARADVYALGLVLIEALTGRRAFPGDPLSAAQARLERDATVPSGLPDDVSALITAMTRGGVDERPDAATVSAGLRRALVEAEPLAMPPVLGGMSGGGRGPIGLAGLGPSGSGGRRGRPRRATAGTRGSPRATGTRGILVIAGLAASAVLAGTVAIASTGPVAEVTADPARPAASVPGGATVGLTNGPSGGAAPAAPPAESSDGPSASQDAPASEAPSRTQEATVAEPVSPARATAAPSPPSHTHSTSTHPSSTETSSTEPSTTSSEPTSTTESTTSSSSSRTAPPSGAVGGLLHGVDGLVGGVLGGGQK